MTDDTPEKPASETPDGVFGNLPKARPGTRSPRRDGVTQEPAGPRAEAAAPEPKPKPKSTPGSARKPAKPAPPPPTPSEGAPARTAGAPSTQAPSTQIKGVEDLAWAGIAVAAEAATAGVRFASKALDAARKSIDRQ